MTAHLGSWVSDLADGQLDAAATERALAHVAACPPCAGELAAARSAHRALAAACDIAPDPELTDRLLALSASIPPSDGDPLRATSRAWDQAAPWSPPLAADLGAAGRRQRRMRLALAGVGGAGVLGATLLVLGHGPVVTPDPSRSAAFDLLAAVDTFPVVTTTDADSTELDQLGAGGWAVPDELPTGYSVRGLRVLDGDQADRGAVSYGAVSDGGSTGTTFADTAVVEIDLAGPDGSVVVRQRHGRLAEQQAEGHLTVPGHDVHVLSTDPWHVAWQAGDTVLDLTADVPDDVVVDLVAAFPGARYDAGVLPQLSRGWTTVTGAFAAP